MRFDRPIGILLLLWPTLWALWMAAGGMPVVTEPADFYRWSGGDARGGLRDERYR